MEYLCPTSHNLDVPFVKKTEYQDLTADALDSITGKKMEDLDPTTLNLDFPFVTKTEYQVLTADADSLPLEFTGKKSTEVVTTPLETTTEDLISRIGHHIHLVHRTLDQDDVVQEVYNTTELSDFTNTQAGQDEEDVDDVDEDLCPTTHNLDFNFDKNTEYQVLTADVETAEVTLLLEYGETMVDFQMECVDEMNPEFFTTNSTTCASCELIDRVVVETLAFFALPD